MKVAFVYDRVNKIGGAERVLEALHELWPGAPLFTSVYDPQNAVWAKKFVVKPSFMQKFPWLKNKHEFFPFLGPFIFESFDFSDFDVVISITSAESKAIITKPETMHLCYCLTPTRYLWSAYNQYQKEPGFGALDFIARAVFNFIAPFLRRWDFVAGQRPDFMIAVSKTVKQRIKKYYKRESVVIYPPVELKKFKPLSDKAQLSSDFFLVVSRLVPYKNVDLVVKAFNQLGLRLKIVGTGNQFRKLKNLARPNIEFLGELTDDQLIGYYQTCLALIAIQEEDFGISLVEAQAAGRPVIVFAKGGAKEIINKETGILLKTQTAEELIGVIKRFKTADFSQEKCQSNAQRFSKDIFKGKFKKFVEIKWKEKNI